MTSIKADISVGELIDKITILEIKQERIADAEKLANIRAELRCLIDIQAAHDIASSELDALKSELKQVNTKLWEIEDDIRDHERNKDFGAAFIALARSVYRANDERAAKKRAINDLTGSTIIEEKSYQDY